MHCTTIRLFLVCSNKDKHYPFTFFSVIQITCYELLYVQLAKLAGNTVIATCGGKEKAMLLRDLGVDRVIDYKAEDIKTVCLSNSTLSLLFSFS